MNSSVQHLTLGLLHLKLHVCLIQNTSILNNFVAIDIVTLTVLFLGKTVVLVLLSESLDAGYVFNSLYFIFTTNGGFSA